MLNPYMTVSVMAPQAEPTDSAKFREEFYEAKPTVAKAAKLDRPYTRHDPMILARVWVQIGRFGRVA